MLYEVITETAPVDGGDTAPPAPPVAAEAGASAQDAPIARRGWRERLAGSGFARSLGALFVRHPRLDDDLLDELETRNNFV